MSLLASVLGPQHGILCSPRVFLLALLAFSTCSPDVSIPRVPEIMHKKTPASLPLLYYRRTANTIATQLLGSGTSTGTAHREGKTSLLVPVMFGQLCFRRSVDVCCTLHPYLDFIYGVSARLCETKICNELYRMCTSCWCTNNIFVNENPHILPSLTARDRLVTKDNRQTAKSRYLEATTLSPAGSKDELSRKLSKSWRERWQRLSS